MKSLSTYPFIAIIIGLLLSTGCGQTSDDIVYVATDATWPPFEFIESDAREIVGFDIDLMNAIAQKAGLEVVYVDVSFDTVLAGVTQCQFDAAISAITITADRMADYNFSTPYFNAGQVLVVRHFNEDIYELVDLDEKIVGVQTDTTGDIEAQNVIGATIQRYDDIGLAFQDLMNGQLDAVIADLPMALGVVGQNPGLIKTVGDIFTDENYGIAVCKTEIDLLERINSALAELIDDGYINDLTQTWIVGNRE